MIGTIKPNCLLCLALIILLMVACSESPPESVGQVEPLPTAAALEPTISPTQAINVPPTPMPTAEATPSAVPTATPPAASPTLEPTPLPTTGPPTATSPPDLSQGVWRLGQPMIPAARSEMPAVTLADWVYVPGGFGGEARLDRYNPTVDQWETLADMPAGRHHLMAAAYADSLYIFGGAQASSWNPTNTVWQYDPATNTWSDRGVMPEQRLAGAAVALDHKIYVVGGVGGSENLLEFTPESSQWRLLPGPVQPREHVNALAFQGELWVLAGRWPGVGELATVEIFDPAHETWRNGPALNIARAGFAAAVVQQQLMVAGGEVIINGRETLDSLEIFAPGQNSWQLGPILPVPMHGVGGAEFQERFLLLGGSREAGAIKNEGQVQIYELLP